MKLSRIIATFFGIGYIGKGAGTIAVLVVCALLYCGTSFHVYSSHRLLLLALVLMAAGVASASQVEKDWGKDSSRVVIDEALGMTVSLLYLPLSLMTIIPAFILFRFFDIAKPLLIRRTEALPKGWGVMADDLLAGIYTNILVRIFILFI